MDEVFRFCKSSLSYERFHSAAGASKKEERCWASLIAKRAPSWENTVFCCIVGNARAFLRYISLAATTALMKAESLSLT
jgi:hypothetical protein